MRSASDPLLPMNSTCGSADVDEDDMLPLPLSAHNARPWYAQCFCCPDSRGSRWSTKKRRHQAMLLPLTARKDMGIASALSRSYKLILMLSNLAYWMAAALCFLGTPIAAPLFECLLGTDSVCSSNTFHGAQVTLMAAVSTYWHGAQVHIPTPGCNWLYCRRDAQGVAYGHTPTCQRRLVLADISCAGLTIVIGCCCFGFARTLSWLVVPILVFIAGARAKRQGDFDAYAIYHSIWHCLSAVAIAGIVLDGDVAFASWIDVLFPGEAGAASSRSS